ncbi:sulfite reductase subunit alpha [Bradyrhizobium tropiciagri]|uniref:sulfite reductase subunit alpha n=1 Tax=Bradyrhizobium tropiciagri TaxID=312253 RepID=UPI001BA501FC|nr:sulfite reductase subunit alpha [Bradyrhizobium tropiciagri]MBR0898826.1 sulfite reductase subunit alpha [Bradyrhizobium tropiciagri]
MTSVMPPREVISPSAPFSDAQRAWLNGLFAGLFEPDDGASPAVPTGVASDGDDGAAPWHDQTMPIAERMKLAENRPLRRRMMAAMAQQDCGQCGFNCSDYADAIANRSEARLNLCVPGGKETARMLKALYAELGGDASSGLKPAAEVVPAVSEIRTSERGRSRDNPVEAAFLSRLRLNKAGSEKETWHLDFDLTDTELDYEVGDSLGVFPKNDPILVGDVIAALGASPDHVIGEVALKTILTERVSLSPAPDTLFQLLSYIIGGTARQKARALASGEDPDGDAASLDVLAALEKFSKARPDPEAFVEALEPLQPRLYSISSSYRASPAKVSLTVDVVRYEAGKRRRLGAASTYLAERIQSGEKLPIYVQKAHGFALPADPNLPIIMVGPGTGVAPFRAFLQERGALGASGRNWLFFGHQRSDLDFFYSDELKAMRSKGLLTRLSLAWSRDSDQKFYVQDRMRQSGQEVWSWLADGAHFYVCGDAKRMAKDVERALVEIVAEFGKRSTDDAIAFVADLKKRGRYQQDVY